MEETGTWHLDRRVSVGHLVTTGTLLVAMLLWAARMDTRVALVEDSISRQVVVDQRQDEEARAVREEIREELKALNEKFDRYLGGRAGPRAGRA